MITFRFSTYLKGFFFVQESRQLDSDMIGENIFRSRSGLRGRTANRLSCEELEKRTTTNSCSGEGSHLYKRNKISYENVRELKRERACSPQVLRASQNKSEQKLRCATTQKSITSRSHANYSKSLERMPYCRTRNRLKQDGEHITVLVKSALDSEACEGLKGVLVLVQRYLCYCD